MKTIFFVALFVYVTYLNNANALQCYVCNGKTGGNDPCEIGPFNDNFTSIVNCTALEIPLTSCIAYKTNDTITRGCADETYCSSPEQQNLTSCTHCNTDLCNNNSSSMISTSWIMSLGAFIVLLLNYK